MSAMSASTETMPAMSASTEARRPVEPHVRALYARVLAGDVGAAQLWFDQAVLDRYRGQPGWRVLRTNSAGRLKSPDGWSLDFGVADNDRLIHASANAVSQRLTAAERPHWIEHLVSPAASRNFVSMQLGGAACIDDGELRDWTA
jgi:hypothetical protein